MHIATHCWTLTVQAQFDGCKHPLNNIEPVSNAFRKLQVQPTEFHFFEVVIEFSKTTSGTSHPYENYGEILQLSMPK